MHYKTAFRNYIQCLLIARAFCNLNENNIFNKFLKTSNINHPEVLTEHDIIQFVRGGQLEDVHLNIVELINKYGYPVEQYGVVTEDGYELRVFRVHGHGRARECGRLPAVLLVHGLLLSADDWVTPGPESGLAYLLAAAGYDVWLANVRGTKHSRGHISLPPDSAAYWDFSWDEMGRYDLPATIDLVLRVSGRPRLLYVGHSQGTTAFFVMAAERPEYARKVDFMVALAPAAAVPNVRSPFLLFLKYASLMHPEIIFSSLRKAGFDEFAPKAGLIRNFSNTICGNSDLANIICSNLVFLICGFSYSQLNITNLPVLFSHSPSGASTKQLEHFAQTVTSKKFQKFNYGKEKNKKIYGLELPPEYDIGKIETPIALFYSQNDWLAAEPDVHVLRKTLKNVVDFYKVPDETFNHVDFLFGIDVKKLIFPRLLKVIREHV